MTIQLPSLNGRGMKALALLTDDDPRHLRPGCDHGDAHYELRTMTTKSGVKQFKFQCLVCGNRGTSIARTSPIVANLKSDPAPIDEELQRRYWARLSAEYQRERDQERAEWWRQYNAYLESEKWRKKRKRVLIRDRFQCQAAMDGCLNEATEVHHLTYEHLFNEPLFELIAVCSRCHEKITELDRKQRAA